MGWFCKIEKGKKEFWNLCVEVLQLIKIVFAFSSIKRARERNRQKEMVRERKRKIVYPYVK